MIITAIDGMPLTDSSSFSDALKDLEAGDTTSLTIYQDGSSQNVDIVLANRADFTQKEKDEGAGYIGVNTLSTNPDIFNPFESSKRLGWGSALFIYIVLPFQGLSPIQSPVTGFYEVTGAWAAIPAPLFWILANALYWLFWINLMLGMTNALPAVPLDGGYLVRDWLETAIRKMKANMRAEDTERAARNVSYLIALFILGLILWQLIGPRI